MLSLAKVIQTPKASSKFILSHFKLLSTQVDVEYESAKPFDSIPGIKNGFEMIRYFGPGGKYKDLPLDKLVETFKSDFGTIAQFPAFLGQRPMVMTFLPEDVEKVFRNEGKFPGRRPLDSMLYFRKQYRPDLYPAGAGLTVTNGQEWYDFRSKVQQPLMQPRATKVYIPGIDEVACDFIKKIRTIRDKNNETPADFFENMNEWALESIGVIALETRLNAMSDSEVSKMSRLVKFFFQATFDFDIQPSIWRYYKTPGFKKAMKVYEELSEEIKKHVMAAVERFEKNPSPSDHEAGILEKLVKVDKNIGIAMAEDMLLAGIDTTSAAVTGVLYNLAKNPDKQEILRKEILTILPEKDSKLTPASFASIPYLRAVIKESLRLSPVTNGNVREAAQNTVLQGYRIPKGMDIMLGSHGLNEAQFKKNDQFIPERWLKEKTNPQCPHAKDAHPFAYLPFGFGSRMCVGRRFAELEIEVLVSRMVREFKLEWNQPDLKFKSITLNIPDGPLKFKLTDI